MSTGEAPVVGPGQQSDPPLNAPGIPEEVQEAINKIQDPQARSVLAVALSRTTTFGPIQDPETMRIAAETEMHEETSRLKGFEASLANRDRQAVRDHEFRKQKLNHQSLMTGLVLISIIFAAGTGLALSVFGNPAIGNPILIASFTMLASIAGKLLSSRD